MTLKKCLSHNPLGNKSIFEYLNSIKSITFELAFVDMPVSDDDMVIHVLNGIGSEFKEIAAAIRVREHPISVRELHDKLVSAKAF